MSLLRTDRLAISLTPTHVGIVHARGGQSSRALVDVKPQHPAQPAWQAALDGVAGWLAAEKPRRAKTTLVLSNRFVRLALMPWSAIPGADEESELAAACLESRYGDMSGWTLRTDAPRYQEPRLVFAVESALLEGVRTVFEKQGLACASIVPAFVAAWNRCRAGLDKAAARGDSLFAVVESDMLTMATRRAGRWQSARAMGLRKGFREVPALLQREGLLQGFTETPPAWVALPIADRHAKAIEAGDPAFRVVGAGSENHAALVLAGWGNGGR